MKWNQRYAKDKNQTAEYVMDQLEDDYPKSTMGWVKDAQWEGPTVVQLHDVNYSNKKSWRAWHEPEIIPKFKKKIKQGKMKPVLLVKTPKNDKYIIIDGHHRSLAYLEMNRPMLAWIGHVHEETGPWDTFHDQQRMVDGEDSTEREVEGKK
jgi:hypothetical protein